MYHATIYNYILPSHISFPFFPIEITWQNTLGAALLIGSILLLTIKPNVRKEKDGANRS